MDNFDEIKVASAPAEGVKVIDLIRSSCERIRSNCNVLINKAACDKFLSELDLALYTECTSFASDQILRFPLQFSSLLDELNVTGMVCLLDCLDAHEKLLKERTGRGAWETTCYLVLSSYLGSTGAAHSSLLTARGMVEVTPDQISSTLTLPLHTERPVAPNSPITIAEADAPVVSLIEDLIGTLHSTGQILVNSGLPDFGSFLAARASLSNDEMIRQLVGTFPCFGDMYILYGQPVYILRKALKLIHVLVNSSLPFPSLRAPAMAPMDNRIFFLLRHLELIDTSQSREKVLATLNSSVTASSPLPPQSWVILQATGIACCHFLTVRLQELKADTPRLGQVTSEGLVSYLENLSKTVH